MIEAMKQALEALENSQRFVEASANAKMLHGWGEQLETAEDAITSLQQAIAELESQEPVAVGEVVNERGEVDYISYVPPVGTALYTTPPAAQRQWVGLTDEEIIRMKAAIKGTLDVQFGVFARAIEAKLKEKNT